MRLVIEHMELEDIAQVLEVDRESYSVPWPASAYRREIVHNRNARYLVMRQVPERAGGHDGESEGEHRGPLSFLPWPLRSGGVKPTKPGRVIGYAGMWVMVDEAHITTIAVRTAWRGRGLGEVLLACLLDTAHDAGAERATLEVRVSNDAAQTLYRKYGFREEGVRKRYYSDNNEDAYIMTTDSIRQHAYQARFHGLVRLLHERLQREPDLVVEAPMLALVESE